MPLNQHLDALQYSINMLKI